jgi:hypothetical protein
MAINGRAAKYSRSEIEEIIQVCIRQGKSDAAAAFRTRLEILDAGLNTEVQRANLSQPELDVIEWIAEYGDRVA